MKSLALINAPSNLGLKQLTADRQPGVNKLPAWLKQHGLSQALQPETIITVEAPAYEMIVDPVSGVLNADRVAEYSKKLSTVIRSANKQHDFLLVIGGDCSILLGCAMP